MTTAEKRERREVKHKLQDAARSQHFSLDARLQMTSAQVRSGARKVADQLLSGKNPHEAISLRTRLVAE